MGLLFLCVGFGGECGLLGNFGFQAAFGGWGREWIFANWEGSLKRVWSCDGSSPTASNRAWLICQDVGEPLTFHWVGFQAAFGGAFRQPENGVALCG